MVGLAVLSPVLMGLVCWSMGFDFRGFYYCPPFRWLVSFRLPFWGVGSVALIIGSPIVGISMGPWIFSGWF